MAQPPSNPNLIQSTNPGVNLLLYEALGWDDFAEVILKHHDAFMAVVPKTPKGLYYYNEWVRGANNGWTGPHRLILASRMPFISVSLIHPSRAPSATRPTPPSRRWWRRTWASSRRRTAPSGPAR